MIYTRVLQRGRFGVLNPVDRLGGLPLDSATHENGHKRP